MRIVDLRQVDLESRSRTRAAAQPNRAVHLLHDAVDRSQPEPRSFSRFLSRKEWLEDMRLRLPVHANARVMHGEHYVFTVRHFLSVLSTVRVNLHIASFQSKPAAMRHRIARVHRQIQNHLLDLSWIR